MKNVLVIGSTCVDVIIRIDHLPKTEEDLHPESQTLSVGGCAYNVANILHRGGADLTFITPVGSMGIYGDFVRKKLDSLGLTDYILLPNKENGCCYCFVEKTGERTFISHHGAEYTFDPEWLKPFKGKRFDLGYICGLEVEEPTGEDLVSYLERENPIKQLIYAPGPTAVRIKNGRNERIYALSPILHLNASEAMALGGCDSVSAAAHALQCQTKNIVIVTMGKQGVYWLEPNGASHTLPGVTSGIVDTIGAGDSHIGATILGLCRDMSLSDAITLGNRTAAEVVSVAGATLPDDIFKRLFQD